MSWAMVLTHEKLPNAENPPLPGVPKELEGKPLDQLRTMRDTLLNFGAAVEQQLVKVAPPPEPPPAQPQAGANPGQQ